jgi:hypothetical protein
MPHVEKSAKSKPDAPSFRSHYSGKGALFPSRFGPESLKDPIVDLKVAADIPLSRENYLRVAGLPPNPEAEFEADLPPEFQKHGICDPQASHNSYRNQPRVAPFTVFK